MSFKVKLNNKLFDGFKGGSLTRSIDSNTGTWNFSSSIIDGFPFKCGDYVQILINDVPKSTGYIDKVSVNSSVSMHEITASGRDNIQDVLDSTVPDDVKQIKTSISFKSLCEKIIQSIDPNIKVFNEVKGLEVFTEKDFANVTTGDKALTFLTDFARKRQVYLVSDGIGNLLIFRPLRDKSATELISKKNNESNNIISSNLDIDFSERYFRYICKSQDNITDSSSDYKTGGTNRDGVAIDREIRKTREFEFQAEETMDDKTCQDRAIEMLNLKRSRGTTYSCTIQGFNQNNGTIWDIGQQIPVDDENAKVKGNIVITSLTFDFSLDSGSITSLECSDISAYQSVEKAEKAKSKIGGEYTKEYLSALPINF